MGKAFVYNTGTGKYDVKDDEIVLNFSVFINPSNNT